LVSKIIPNAINGTRKIRIFFVNDLKLNDDDLDNAKNWFTTSKNGQVQFPAIIGGTVPIINLEGFKPGELRITGPVLAEVFMGTISKWNDPKFAALNPGKTLPDQIITVVHRADGSGTTFNWTDYLTVVSKEWADKVGRGAAVKWLPSTAVGGKGNEGVAANVSRIRGSIGYVEYAYVKKNKLNYLQMQNKSGKWVHPDDLTFAAAGAGADWFSVPGMGLSIVDQRGDNVWPVSTASFIIMYRNPENKKDSQEALKFFDWAFRNGAKMSEELDYVHLPVSLQEQIRQKVWSQIQK
jgi:phosphate transport system substrate-binding protein